MCFKRDVIIRAMIKWLPDWGSGGSHVIPPGRRQEGVKMAGSWKGHPSLCLMADVCLPCLSRHTFLQLHHHDGQACELTAAGMAT